MNMCKILLFFVLTIIILHPDFVVAEVVKIEGCSPTIALTITLSEAASSRLNDIIKVRNKACQTMQNSKNNANRAGFLFRLIGTLLLLVSVSIPLLSSFEGSWKISSFEGSWKKTVSIAALSVAFMTGINGFFDFQGTWGFSRQAQYELRYQIIKWEQSISVAQYNYLKNGNDEKVFLEKANFATDELIAEWDKGVKKRAGQYFNDQDFSL